MHVTCASMAVVCLLLEKTASFRVASPGSSRTLSDVRCPRISTTHLNSVPDDLRKVSQRARVVQGKSSAEFDLSRKTKKAPVVDSTLLRFLASKRQIVRDETVEKGKEKQIVKEIEAEKQLSRKQVLNRRSESNSLDTKAVQLKENDTLFDEEETRLKTSTGRREGIADRVPFEETQSGSAQNFSYQTLKSEAGHIAQALVRAGADGDTAMKAGWEVQRYIHDKDRRVSIRRFLRSRDSLWANASSPPSAIIQGLDEAQDRTTSSALRTGLCAQDRGNSQNIKKVKLGRKSDVIVHAAVGVINELMRCGLTGKDCATILGHTPSLALRGSDGVVPKSSDGLQVRGETVENTVRRVLSNLLCDTLRLRKYDARKIMRSCPGLLTVRGSISAEQVVDLMFGLGVSYSALARDKTALPILISRSPSAIFRLVAFLSSESVRMPVEKIGSVLRKAECSKLLDVVAPVANVRFSLAQSGVLHGNEVCANTDDVYENMKQTAECLRDAVGLEDLSKIISAYPAVLLSDPGSQIIPVVSFLYNDIGLNRHEVMKTIESYPPLMGANPVNLRQVVDYLESLDLSRDSLGKVFRAFPSLLILDVSTTMVPVVEFLRGIGVVNIGRFVTRLPAVLGYSVEKDLIPKWDFLNEVCAFGFFEVVRFPAYFSYPLERIIVPRYEYLRARGVPYELVSVDDVLRFGDSDFATKVAGDKDGGAFYARFIHGRTKTGKNKEKRQSPVLGKRRQLLSNKTEERRPTQRRLKVDATRISGSK